MRETEGMEVRKSNLRELWIYFRHLEFINLSVGIDLERRIEIIRRGD